MTKLRVGILSFAHLHAEEYIGNLQNNPMVEYIGFADDDDERLQRFGELYDSVTFNTYEELLATEPDAVVVCSENSKHRELVEMAASVGVHVLCEKPIATTIEDAEAMIAACEGAGVNLMIAFPMRFSAPARLVKAALDRGDLGTLYCANTTNQGENPDYHRKWFSDKALAGGGAVVDHTVHVVDLMRWYMGAEPIEVYAEVGNLFYKDTVDVDTAGLVYVTFDNGVFMTLDSSWSRPRNYPTWGNVKIDLVGEKGVLRTDYFMQKLDVYPASGVAWDYWGSDHNAGMINEFLASIREGRKPMITGEDGLAALRVVLAAYESGESHEVVRLSES